MNAQVETVFVGPYQRHAFAAVGAVALFSQLKSMDEEFEHCALHSMHEISLRTRIKHFFNVSPAEGWEC